MGILFVELEVLVSLQYLICFLLQQPIEDCFAHFLYASSTVTSAVVHLHVLAPSDVLLAAAGTPLAFFLHLQSFSVPNLLDAI